MNAVNYVISVDTGTFHLAGGLHKPMTGIFTWTDGKIRGNCYDFILVQNHRDDGWECGPCWSPCDNIKCQQQITMDMLLDGINKMFLKWPLP